jgi:hypothetical protein
MTTITDTANTTLTIRHSTPADESALVRLAQLDSTRPISATRVLVAEEDGELVAARPLDDGEAIANPFRRTAATMAVLEARAAELERAPASADLQGRELRRALGPLYAGA